MNRRLKKKWIAITGIIFVVAAFMIILMQISARKEKKPNLRVDKLKELECIDVAQVEDKIRMQEEARREKEREEIGQMSDERSPNEKMEYTVVMGDSRTVGMIDFQTIDASKIIAETGIHISELDAQIEQAVRKNPKALFLAYGLNDIEYVNGDVSRFKEQYKALLEKLCGQLPDTAIYVNAIQPVQQKAIDKNPILSKVLEFNQAIQEVCKEENVVYIDITEIMKEEYYAPDGIHFQPAYYPVWIDKMAEAADL